MPATRSSSCSSLRPRSRGTAAIRASPARDPSPGHALATDVRQFVSSLNDSFTAASNDDSVCSVGKPHEQGSPPAGYGAQHGSGLPRPPPNPQCAALADKVTSLVSSLQRQCDADRRRLAQLERKLEARLDESLRESLRETDGREKWAEVQGSVKGLLEETQALTRRVEGLDERLWARTSGSEAERQRHRELEQQVQALEQHSRLHAVTAEETQKRQVAKLLRVDHAVEDMARHIGKLEEEMHVVQSSPTQQHHLEQRVSQLQQQFGHLDSRMRSLQLQVSESLQAMSEVQGSEDGAAEQSSRVDEAVQATERGMAALEKRVVAQVKDISSSLASLRVKSDGQIQRVASLAERLETAHEPLLEAMRAELSQARSQDRRQVEADVAALRAWMQEVSEGNDEAVAEVRQAVRQAHAEIAAATLRPAENSALRALDERAGAHEREVFELRARFDALPGTEQASVAEPEHMSEAAAADLEDIRKRLEWLEEKGAVSTATEKMDHKKAAQAQETVCDLVAQVSRLSQRAAAGEATCGALQQQLQQLPGLLEARQGEAAVPSQVMSEVQVRCGEISKRVAKIDARLMEVEGGLQYVQESGGLLGGEASPGSETTSTMLPPGPRTPPLGPPEGQERAPREDDKRHMLNDLQRKLEAVAEHLEAIDVLSERVTAIERQLRGTGAAAEVTLMPVAGRAEVLGHQPVPRAAPRSDGTPESPTSADST